MKFLPGQHPVLQLVDSESVHVLVEHPLHLVPPPKGFGLVQVRVLVFVPPPQVTVQVS